MSAPDGWWTPQRTALATLWLIVASGFALLFGYAMAFALGFGREPYWAAAWKMAAGAGSSAAAGPFGIWLFRRRKWWLLTAMLLFTAGLVAAVIFAIRASAMPTPFS